MFKVVEHTIAADLAASGTFDVSYPDGTNAGTFRGSVGHIIATKGGDKYTSPANFTVSFGTSNVTITSVDMVLDKDVSNQKNLYVQFEMVGENDGSPSFDRAMERVTAGVVARINLGAPDTADANGYIESQDLTTAGVFSVSTTVAAALLAAALDGVADVPRNVVAAWTTTAVLTITGTDEFGNTIVESSASGTTLTGKKAFKTVTNVETSVNITSLTVGTGDVLGLPVFLPERSVILGELQDGVMLSPFVDKINVPFFINQTDLLAPTAAALVAPCAGYITGLKSVVQVAITTGGAITVEANTVAVVGLSVTHADADAAGVVKTDSVERIATGLVAAGDDITVTPAAAFATAGAVNGHIEIEPLHVLNGTLVAGVDTEPTATTGDVRGSYDPAMACNGSLAFELLVLLADPSYRGRDQYAG
ncbi:MAG: hypothetical protein A3E78_12100 [Alphaproteobacteria bacterium RIFCSPHIGHO2_12_FULL_63_12]|nr:MAG: hypothetical protein A3E78_12100 [Alphaproteobacteria bacterium RIFCSPHIGHO2_12_FULL_63_12]